MTDIFHYLVIGLIVLLANVLESITGFGATVAELPLVSSIVGIKTAVVALCMVSLTLSSFVVIKYHKKVDEKAYLNIIICALIGMPIGMLAFSHLPERTLKIGLGIFIIFAAVHGFIVFFSKRKNRKPPHNAVLRLMLLLGGIVHGAFASGGPFLVIYASQKIDDKGSFRATMCAVWVTLNSMLLIKYIFTGTFVFNQVMPVYLAALPFLAAGAAIGFFLHKKVSQRVFSFIVCFIFKIITFFIIKIKL